MWCCCWLLPHPVVLGCRRSGTELESLLCVPASRFSPSCTCLCTIHRRGCVAHVCLTFAVVCACVVAVSLCVTLVCDGVAGWLWLRLWLSSQLSAECMPSIPWVW